ncbi:MAG TPA: tetratricopeptide repeat protein [Thermoanaerobaculia bacterium]|nr:tetratricopeptide repeat protein [Thermoanaerobaculia bacterium]
MRTSIARAALAALVLALAFTATLRAAGEGRVIATVTDESGKPIEGAKVALTRAGTATLEKVSDKKGQVLLLIRDATLDYQIAITKEGYGPYQGSVKPKFEDTVRLTFTLPKVAAAAGAANGADQAVVAYNDGVAALGAGNLAAALPKLESAATLDPKLPEAQAALAQVYLDLKRYGDSLAASDRYLALKPGDPAGLRTRYDALKGVGDNEKAREALDALAAADPQGPETAVRFFNEGAERSRTGKLDEATAFFERVVQIAPADPKFAKAHYVLGLTYAKDDAKKAQAKEQLQAFLQMAPNDPDAATAKDMLAYLK